MKVLNAGDTAGRELWVGAVKAAVVISCGVVPAILLGMEALDSLTLGPRTSSEATRSWLVGALLILLPAGLYAALIHTKIPVLCFGVGLFTIEAWSIWKAYAPGTSGLALFWIPAAGIPFVLLGWAVDVWVRAMRPLTPPA